VSVSSPLCPSCYCSSLLSSSLLCQNVSLTHDLLCLYFFNPFISLHPIVPVLIILARACSGNVVLGFPHQGHSLLFIYTCFSCALVNDNEQISYPKFFFYSGS
jgi:hypothetical protein